MITCEPHGTAGERRFKGRRNTSKDGVLLVVITPVTLEKDREETGLCTVGRAHNVR